MHPDVRRALRIAVLAAALLAVSATAASAAPSIVVTQAPPATTTATNATISFRASGFTPTSTTCSLDGARARSCRSPVSYTGLSARTHSLAIVARRGRQSATAVVRWTVTTAPAPSVSITSGPSGQTESTGASIAWQAANASRVELSLDGGPYAVTANPAVLAGLAPGSHTAVLRATGAGGTATASRTWTVVAPAPPPGVSPTAPAAPRAPAAYAVPAGALRVTTAAELQAALATTPARDIVLADGRYETSGWFSNHEGHRLYAERLGGAVLASGLEIGANWGSGGAVVQGVTFDVSSLAKTFHGALVHVWGPGGASARVVDCVFRGNGAIAFGLLVYNPAGLVAERLAFSSFTDVALRASDNQAVAYGGSTPRIASIADIAVDGVSRPTPGASDGTAEAGVWIGHPVTAGVHRIAVRNVSWSGIETVNNAWDTTFTDLDVDMSGPRAAAAVGIYLEHFNHRNVFERFRITGAATGITAEWADPAWGGVAGAHDTVIRDGLIDASGASAAKTFGVYLDEGTVSTTITGVVFRNQSFAAIGAYRTAGTNRFEGNDTSGLRAGALPLSTAHWSSPTP
jgi:hypothetical protein